MSVKTIITCVAVIGAVVGVKVMQNRYYNNLARNTMNELLKNPKNKEVLRNLATNK